MTLYACDWCWGHRKKAGSSGAERQELRVIAGNQAVCEACYEICVKEENSPDWLDLPKQSETDTRRD